MTQSKVKWVRLGDYIEARNERNSKLQYGVELIEGVNSDGEFQPTKAVTDGIDLLPYKAVWPGDICYNPSRLNIGSLAFREKDAGMCIVSHLYQVFHIKKEFENELIPEYLLIFFKRDEFSRIVDYYNYGSQRAEFNLKKLSELQIPLPSITRQREIVETWQGLRKMKEENEQIAEPLLQLCQSYIQDLKKKYPMEEIGEYIIPSDEVNVKGEELPILGLNKDKVFMPTAANTATVDVSKYKVVRKGRFAFSGMQTGRDVCIRLSLYDNDSPAVISPAYTTFEINESKGLLSEYLYILFCRSEMDRLGWFLSDSSVRSNLDWPRFVTIRIPLPPIDVQHAIVNIYNCAKEAKRIANEADQLSRDICPALMQQVINE